MAAMSLWPAAARAALQPSSSKSAAALALSAASALSGARLGMTPVLCKESMKLQGRELQVERDTKSIATIFSPTNLGMTFVRNALICYMPLVEQYFRLLEDAARREEEGEVPGPVEFSEVSKANEEVARKISRDLSVQATRRVIARYIRANYPERVSRKMLKDLPLSARRKAERYTWLGTSRFDRGLRIGNTVWQGNLVPCLSELLVQFTIVSYDAWSRHTRGDKTAFRRWMRRSAQAVLRFGAVRVTTAACAGTAFVLTGGSAGRPAYWTAFAGFALGDLIANTWVTHLTDPWVAAASAEIQ